MLFIWIDFYLFLFLLLLFIYVLAVSEITTLHKTYLAFHSLMMVWPICNFFMHMIPDESFQWVLLNIAFVGLCFLGYGWLIFALILTNKISCIKRTILYFSVVPPVLCSLLVTTNPWHFLFTRPSATGWTIRTYGPLFWVFFACSLGFLIVATALMLKTMAATAKGSSKKRLSLCIRGIMLLLLFSLLDILFNVIIYPAFGIVPGLTSLGIIISAVCFVVAIQKYDLFKIMNIARREVIDSMAAGIIVMDENDFILDINKSAAKILNIRVGQIPDIQKFFLDNKQISDSFAGEYTKYKFKFLQTEITFNEGHPTHIAINVAPVFDARKKFLGRIITLNDITDLRLLLDKIYEKNMILEKQNLELMRVQKELNLANKKLEIAALTDGLTDCYNKRYLLQHLAHEISGALRYKFPFSVLIFDLDNFKLFNDTYGHLAGDEVLQGVVAAVRRNLRRSDVLARFGGEEFVVYLPQTEKEGATFFAEKIRLTIQNHSIKISGKNLNITASIGLVCVDPKAEPIKNPDIFLEQLLLKADKALYRAKANGRNCVVDAS